MEKEGWMLCITGENRGILAMSPGDHGDWYSVGFGLLQKMSRYLTMFAGLLGQSGKSLYFKSKKSKEYVRKRCTKNFDPVVFRNDLLELNCTK